MKLSRKRLCIIVVVLPYILFLVKCNQAEELKKGKDIYKVYCVNCHGADGRLGTNAAMDLSRSRLPMEGRKEIIRHGRVTMMGFDGVLSEAQIDSVAHYTLRLQK